MEANEYQQACLRTAPKDIGPTNSILNGVMGLNGEAGECIDIMKKYLFQGHVLNKPELALELGDVAWYLAVCAHAIDYELEDIFKMNIEKLEARYPDGFDSELSVNRKEGDL